MGTTQILMLLLLSGALLIIGFAWLMGTLTPKKQAESRCPSCDKVIRKGSTVCEWCGKDIPATQKTS
jgi:hypothetical protein